jgi:hypothetical protein
VAPKAERTAEDVAGRGGDSFYVFATAVEGLTVAFFQQRFVIEGIDLAGAAIHEKLYDAASPGSMVQTAVEVRCRRRTGQQAVSAEQVGERNTSEASPHFPQKLTAREGNGLLSLRTNGAYGTNTNSLQLNTSLQALAMP